MWETHYLTDECGYGFSKLRRKIAYDVQGNIVENKTTIDISEDSKPHRDKYSAMIWDLGPNPDYKSEEKIERDIHHSFYKFSRQSKIKKLPTFYEPTSCLDIIEFFPNAFDNVYFNPNGSIIKDIDTKERAIYEYSFSDYFFFDILKYKFSWTFYYDSLEDAINDNNFVRTTSEFSFRIYSPGDGFGPWQYEGLVFASDLYKAVLDYYGESY